MSFYPSGIENNGGAAGGLATAAGTFFGGPVGGAIAGSLASGLFNRSSAKDQMKFQERMASTQYQRAAKDLEAAGLNRVLALGSPAAAPGGAMGTMPDLGQALSSGFQASTASKGQKSLQSLQEAQVSSARAQIEQTQAQTALTKLLTPAQVSKANSEAISADKNAQRDAMINKALETIAPGVDSLLDLVGKGVSSATDAFSGVGEQARNLLQGLQSSAKSAGIPVHQIITDKLGVTGYGKAKKADEEWERKRKQAEADAEDKERRKHARNLDKDLY